MNLLNTMESNLNIEIKDFNGPLDVLLDLVHKNKYDLKNLPILHLCNQYISFKKSCYRHIN